MIRPTTRHIVPLALLGIMVAGCSATAPARFYTLDAVATSTGEPASHSGVVVGPVTIPPALDRPQLVIQVAAHQVDIDEYNRWAAPLADGIAAAIAGNLATLLGTSDVVAGAAATFNPFYRVTLDVQHFASVPGKEAFVDVVWAIRKTTGGPPRSGRSVVHEPVQGQDMAALAAAHSRALASVSADIAAAIRATGGRDR